MGGLDRFQVHRLDRPVQQCKMPGSNNYRGLMTVSQTLVNTGIEGAL